MKYVRTPGSLIDLRRLPDEHHQLFVESVHAMLHPALDAGAHAGQRRGFRLAEVAGETVVVWLRVGNHGIYDS